MQTDKIKSTMHKYRVVQHVAGFGGIGGPAAQLAQLLSSHLSEDYDFKVVSQDRPAHGINISLILEMSRAMRRFRPDLVHVRGLQNEGFHGILAAYLAGCRNVVVSVHGFVEDAQSYNPIKRWIISRILEPLTIRLAHGIYCVCREAADRIVVKHCKRKNFGVIHNGINITAPVQRDDTLRMQLGASANDVVALYVGRISRDKGLFVLAEALRQMKNPPIVWLAGDGSDMSALRLALGLLTDSGRVHLLGPRENVPALLGACDFFVLPTLHENLSNAILEAMLAERAVLTTGVGGNRELVINGVTGYLIPAGDPVALARGLEFLSENPNQRTDMGRRGRERIEKHFSMDQVTEHLRNVYNTMLNRTKER